MCCVPIGAQCLRNALSMINCDVCTHSAGTTRMLWASDQAPTTQGLIRQEHYTWWIHGDRSCNRSLRRSLLFWQRLLKFQPVTSTDIIRIKYWYVLICIMAIIITASCAASVAICDDCADDHSLPSDAVHKRGLCRYAVSVCLCVWVSVRHVRGLCRNWWPYRQTFYTIW